jgi:hypothetical protein
VDKMSTSDPMQESAKIVPDGGTVANGRQIKNLAKLKISSEGIRALPSEFVKRYRVLPLEIHNSTIDIATADLGNQRVIDDIRLLTGLEVQEFEAPANEIIEKIAECYLRVLSGHGRADDRQPEPGSGDHRRKPQSA